MNKKPKEKKNYNGLSVNERLAISGLLDKFQAAARRGNRKIMISILQRVSLSKQTATHWVDTLLGDETFFYR